jgi:uncharacterized protein involved in type VI secretion and phage assembly
MDDLLARLLEKVENRYYGKYRAFVVDNADPENRGRLRLRIPSVLGNDVVSGWAMPCAPYGGAADQGFFFIPEVDAGVWVEFEAGHLDYPIWVGTFWSKPGGTTEVPKPGDEQSPPTSKIIKTLKHTIELADEEGSAAIKITDDANSNIIVIDSNGIAVEDANGNKLTLDSSGIKAEDKNGNAITMDSSSVTVKSNQIKIGEGASVEKLVLGTTLNQLLTTWYNLIATHTHIGNLGAPTSPPTPPLVPPVLTSALSTKHVVE